MDDQKHGALGTGPVTLNGGTLLAEPNQYRESLDR